MKLYIKEAREQAGLSQKQLAEMIGVAPNTFHGYESGKHDPKPQHLAAIAAACGVSADFLLGRDAGEGGPVSLGEDALRVARDYNGLDRHGKRAVLGLLQTELDRLTEAAGTPDNLIVLPTPEKKMKRFLNPVSAGPGSYLFGDGYEEIDVPITQKGDYVVTVSGDSMEPYIHDGQDLFVSMGAELQEGDVGIFLVEGSTYCKQFVPGYGGFVHLMSLNRNRADKDLYVNTTLTRIDSLGKVLLEGRPPVPFVK